MIPKLYYILSFKEKPKTAPNVGSQLKRESNFIVIKKIIFKIYFLFIVFPNLWIYLKNKDYYGELWKQSAKTHKINVLVQGIPVYTSTFHPTAEIILW